MRALEKAAKEKGATKVILGSKPDFCNLGNFYRRQGYSFLEEHYIKAV